MCRCFTSRCQGPFYLKYGCFKVSSLGDVCAAGGWFSPHTFIKFYSVDVGSTPRSRSFWVESFLYLQFCLLCKLFTTCDAGILSVWWLGYFHSQFQHHDTVFACSLERESLRHAASWCHTSIMLAQLLKTSESGESLMQVLFIDLITCNFVSPKCVLGQVLCVCYT